MSSKADYSGTGYVSTRKKRARESDPERPNLSKRLKRAHRISKTDQGLRAFAKDEVKTNNPRRGIRVHVASEWLKMKGIT